MPYNIVVDHNVINDPLHSGHLSRKDKRRMTFGPPVSPKEAKVIID